MDVRLRWELFGVGGLTCLGGRGRRSCRARRPGPGATRARATRQVLDAGSLDPRREALVAVLVGPVVVDQAPDDEHRVALLEPRAGLGQLPPHVDVDVVGALLVAAAAVAEALVHGQAEARDRGAAGRVAQFGVAGQVADEQDVVEGVAQSRLAARVGHRGVVAAAAEGQDLDALGVDVERRSLLPVGGLPGAVVQAAFDEGGAALLQLVGQRLGLGTEHGDPVVPGELARLAVVADHVVVAGEVQLQDGQAARGVAQLGRLRERADQVDVVQSSCHLGLLTACGHRRTVAGGSALGIRRWRPRPRRRASPCASSTPDGP